MTTELYRQLKKKFKFVSILHFIFSQRQQIWNDDGVIDNLKKSLHFDFVAM